MQHCASVFGEQNCGLENYIKQLAAKNTADNKTSKKRSGLSRKTKKRMGKEKS
jgi:hypothetical protein